MSKWDEFHKDSKHCRWCGVAYRAHKPVDRDGFCKDACKMAHARAYKKYVTRKNAGSRAPDHGQNFKVTKKKEDL